MAPEIPYPHMSDQEKCAHIRQRAHSVTEAVQMAAWLQGISVAEHQARLIAEVALSFSDSVLHIRQAALKHEWAIDAYREHIRHDMRHKLIDTVAQQGYIPLALPAEALMYMDRFFYPGADDVDAPCRSREVPAEAVEQGAEWESVILELSVPVRRPPVDRYAAVRAGILAGTTAPDGR